MKTFNDLDCLRQILASSMEGFWIVDLEGRIRAVNEAYCRMVGYTRDELLEMKISDVERAETPERITEHIRLITTKGQQRFETRHRRKDNTLVELEVNTNFLDVDGGQFVAFFRDITDRKQVAEELRREHERTQKYLDVVNVILVAIDADQRISLINRKGCKVLECDEQSIIGQNWFDTFISDDIREEVRRVFETLMAGQVPPFEYYENVVRTLTGTEKTIAWHNTVLTDENGTIIGTLSSGEDVTDRKRDEELLRASEIRYRTLFNSANDALFVMDGETFVDCNPQAYRLYGATRDQILNRSPLDFSPSRQPDGQDSREKAGEKLNHALTRGGQRFEWQHCRNDGSLFDVEVSLNKMELAGGTSLLAVVHDITERKQIEKRLQNEKEFTDNALNAQLDTFFVFDPSTGKPIRWNKAFNEISGYSDEEIAAMKAPDDWYSGEDLKKAAATIERSAGEGQATVELSLIAKDGRHIPTEYLVSVIKDSEGHPRYLIAIGRDITARKRVQEALRESEQKFRNIVETSPMGMHLYSLESDDRLVFTGANPAANKILGVDFDSYIGKTIEEAFPPLVHTEVPGEYRRIARHGGVWQTEQLEYQDEHISGAYEIFAFQTEPGAMAAMFLDITERKRTEDALRESKERFRAVFESAQDSIFIKNREMQYTLVNPAMEQLLGKPASEIVGRTAQDLFGEETGRRLSINDAMVLAGKITNEELSHRFGDTIRTFDVVKVPLRDNEGRVIGIGGINRDITDRKNAALKMQAYQDQLRALSSELFMTEERERRHIANDLHDSICQYLALAQVKLSALEKSTAPRELAEAKESIHDLLALALTEARSLTNELSPPMLYHVGLEPALVSLAEQMQKQYGLRVAVHCPDEKVNIIDDDLRAALFRATRELLINIVKHAQTSRANVTLWRDENQLQIEVNDAGVGFDLADVEKQKKQKGRFGLFSIEERLTHLGGNMKISSQPGKGTRVNISVPLSDSRPVGGRPDDK